ncbi:MAG: beta-N-acetylhexosaminidase, partial [Clostridiaceae bacterium]|nr:beta-N-acetylhexosaminidase [Clostridiaceae bacterium]
TLCYVLELKCDMGLRIRNAYQSRNKEVLNSIAHYEIPELINRLEKLMEAINVQWESENKIFGLDVLDLRIGGLKQRLESAAGRLVKYINGEIEKLEELDGDVLFFDCRDHDENDLSIGPPFWHQIVSANIVCGL